jgi:uncharacterized membrane protein
MDDKQLSIAAALFELGTAVCALAFSLYAPKFRKTAIVVVGALSFPVVLYLFVATSYLLNPADKGNAFAFYAMWAMTFEAYLAVFAGAVILSLVPRPSNLFVRFALGVASVPVSYLLFSSFA